MLFKGEAPPPRYSLEGDVEDQEVLTERTFKLEIKAPDNTGSLLVLLAPRCAQLASDIGGVPLSVAHLVCYTRPKQLVSSSAVVQDFYEVDAAEEDFTTTKQYPIALVRGPHDCLLAILPPVDEAQSAFLGRELVLALKPSKVVLATPGSSFMESDVCYLANSQYMATAPPALQQIPRAEPPVIVQGAGAAAVSRAQQLHLPCLALVVSADGPPNYEAIRDTSLRDLRRALFDVLNLKLASSSQVENRMSVLYV